MKPSSSLLFPRLPLLLAFLISSVQATPTRSSGKATLSPPIQGKIVFATNKYDPSEIGVVNADGTNSTRLTHNDSTDDAPCFSRDGKRVVFASLRDGGDDDIFVMDPNGRNPKPLTKNDWLDAYPSFSPDGKKIVWTSSRSGNNEIWVMNPDGTNQKQLTKDESEDNRPCFSPDGSKIAFVSDRTGTPHIYVMNADGSNQVQLTHNSECDMPTFSPDGKKIAYVVNQWEIYIMNADGSNPVCLSKEGSDGDSSPCFSPDGRMIAYASKRKGSNSAQIYIMNVDGTKEKRVTLGEDVLQLSWAPGSVPAPARTKAPIKPATIRNKPTKFKPAPITTTRRTVPPQLPPLNKALFEATRKADIAQMTALLNRGAGVNTRDLSNGGVTPLYLAIRAKSLPAVRVLISRKANVSAGISPYPFVWQESNPVLGSEQEISPLDYATSLNQVEIVKVLLKAGAQSFGENKTAQVFRIAAQRNALEIMQLLLAEDEGQSRAHNASSAMLAAASRGHVQMTKLLVESGADTRSCSAALLNACSTIETGDNSLQIANAALSGAKDLDLKDDLGNPALLYLAYKILPPFNSVEELPTGQQREQAQKWLDSYKAKRGHILALVSALLAKGANPDILGVGGYTPLLLALEKGDGELVRVLLDGGAKPDYAPSPFPSPLRFLAQNGRVARFNEQPGRYGGDISPQEIEEGKRKMSLEDLVMARLLIEKGADLKLKDNQMALGDATISGNVALFHELLEKGMDANAEFEPRDYYITPLHRELTTKARQAMLQEQEVKQMAAKEQGADALKRRFYTPLQLAAATGNVELAKALLAAGADVNARNAQGSNALDFLMASGRTALIAAIEHDSAHMQRDIDVTETDAVKPLPAPQMQQWSQWASAGNLALAAALIEKGCAVNAPKENGPSTLQLAAQNSDLAVVDLLLKAGAKVPQETILFDVVERGRRQRRVLPALAMLQATFTEIDRVDLWDRSNSPGEIKKSLQKPSLQSQRDHAAAFSERTRLLKTWGERDAAIVTRLLHAGAAIEARNAAGLTPLMLAARLGQIEVVRALLSAGADRMATNRAGESIATQAMRYGSSHVTLPIKQKAQTGTLAESWLTAPAIQRRATFIFNKLRQEDQAIASLVK